MWAMSETCIAEEERPSTRTYRSESEMLQTNKEQSLRMYNPSSPPAWRWELAGKIVRGDHVDGRMVDATVEAAARLRAELEGSEPSGRFAARESPLSLARAHELYQESGLRRAEVEARLVAGQSDEQIGDKCGVAPEVVAMYAQVFCDIRQSLSAGDYIQVHLIGPGAHGGFHDHEVGRFWASIALGGGPAVLDQMIEVFHAARRSDQPAGLSVYLQPDAGVPIDMQATVASTVLPKTGPAAEAFCGMHLLLIESRAADDPDRAACLRERARDWLIKCARAHLAGKPLPRPRRRATLGRKAEKMPKGKPLTFEQWDDLVTAAFSDRRVTRPRKS
jgi:hypothetical protein